MTSDQDRFLRSKLSEDSAHLVKENALLNQQVLELTKQLDRVRRLRGQGAGTEPGCGGFLTQQVLELTKQLDRVRRPRGAGCRDRTRVWGLPDPAGPRAHQAAQQGASSSWGRVQGQNQGVGAP